ncbi:MAG TPA: hypothetical protein VGR92_06030 [Steroidobacteraceae bacterium]|nr:hypothetical protein [Steroidobacteraceae bacterium]
MSAVALSPLERIPTFVRNVNALAERAGMRVSLWVGPYDDDPEVRLWSVWEGTRAQLASLQLFTPRQTVLLPIGAYRTKGAWINAPRAGIVGEMQCRGESIRWDIDSGDWPCTIEQRGELEVITCQDYVTYWAAPEALIAFGIDRKRLPLGKICVRSSVHPDKLNWTARRLLDGTIRYHEESEACMRRRIQEREQRRREWEGVDILNTPPSEWPSRKRSKAETPRPRLQLVVDNARKGEQ